MTATTSEPAKPIQLPHGYTSWLRWLVDNGPHGHALTLDDAKSADRKGGTPIMVARERIQAAARAELDEQTRRAAIGLKYENSGAWKGTL